ncbi:hypothetical protein Tco_1522872 [Tanacetum coccineum]
MVLYWDLPLCTSAINHHTSKVHPSVCNAKGIGMLPPIVGSTPITTIATTTTKSKADIAMNVEDASFERKIHPIYTHHGAAPVARVTYRLAPLEMKELAEQLQELSEKGFIRPSSSPWEPQFLLSRKNDRSRCASIIVD